MSYTCTYEDCNAKFARPSKLEVHLRKHSGERPFVCNEENCDKTYTNESHLRRHKLRSHQKDEKIKKLNKCNECSSEFVSLDNLKRHKRSVHDKFNYECSVCKEKFHKKCKLRAHMFEHTGGLKCKLCSKEFENIIEFTKHKGRHKTYTCTCGKVFIKWTVFCKHRRAEHGKLTCPVCNKQFVQKKDVKIHLQVHQETRKVLECPMENCGRLYYYKRNLAAHIETFHLKVKKPLPPSKTINKKEPKPPKTLETGRRTRKDKNAIKKSTALKLTGMVVPYEGEKSILEGKQIDVEISDYTSEYSDIEMDPRFSRKDMSDSDSSAPRMISVC